MEKTSVGKDLENAGDLRPRLLITGGGGAGSEALARLMEHRYDVFFADADIGAKPHLISADRWHQIPPAAADEFVHEIRALCRRLHIDLLIPAVDEELLPISHLRAEGGVDVLLPPEPFVARHLDKLDSSRFLRQAGLPAPETSVVTERGVGFPCIVKPRHGRGSRNVATVRSEKELQAHILLSHLDAEEFVAQELMLGQEFTVMMAANRAGRLRAVVPVLVERKRGITLRAMTFSDKNVTAACKAIHAADPVPGCYNIQLIQGQDGSVKPFEINPRISTTACLGLASGVDFADIFLGASESSDEDVGELMPFKNLLGLNRSWHNEFFESEGSPASIDASRRR